MGGGICVLTEVESESDCEMVYFSFFFFFLFSYPLITSCPFLFLSLSFIFFFLSQFPSAEWETCQRNELSDCSGGTEEQKYLGCYISLWHRCPNQVFMLLWWWWFLLGRNTHTNTNHTDRKNVRQVVCVQIEIFILLSAHMTLLLSRL